MSAGKVSLGRPPARGNLTEEYYRVAPKVTQKYGQDAYTVVITRDERKVARVALRYYPHQDTPENGSVARALMGFATGVNLGNLELYSTQCDTYIKNNQQFFIIQPPIRMNLTGSNEGIVAVSDFPSMNMGEYFSPNAVTQVRRDMTCKEK
ncbi:hypothetical protein ACFP81_11670 [Deinococcus lacus]|uniref:Uncharacterized protein n=1 Tax=Deinococcus lacus TaxID=392561 RepID=A0ABW1YGB6_9DEIO